MKTKYLLLFLVFSVISSTFIKGNKGIEKEYTVISKKDYRRNPREIDTLRVSQNDVSVFKREEEMINRPCTNPELIVRYELIHPKDRAYYLIYNNKKQLVMEGKYSSEYTYEGITYKRGDFYNSKRYSYTKSGSLDVIHYMEDGRNLKTEYYDSKQRLTKITYLDKKSEGITKIEIYKNGQLKETRVYTSFSKYNTVRAKD